MSQTARHDRLKPLHLLSICGTGRKPVGMRLQHLVPVVKGHQVANVDHKPHT